MDLKSLFLATGISILAGSGLYGFYVKIGFTTNMEQVNAYELIGKCSALQSSNRITEIQQFLDRVNQQLPHIRKSDAVIMVLASSTEKTKKLPAAMGVFLRDCVGQLKKRRTELNRNW